MKWSFFSTLAVICFSFFEASAQVNPQNGAAQFSLPLYSYSDPGNRLDLSTSLVYVDGNGLPVSEMASSVGTGWMLNCGGSITRIQRGQPDDQKLHTTLYDYNSQFGVYVQNDYPDGYLYNSTYSPADVIDDGGGYAPYLSSISGPPSPYDYVPAPKYTADREQDIFEFTFNGRSGKFVIGQNKTVETLNDSKLKISFVETDMSGSGIRTQISQFTITDESGIQYVFKDLELGYAVLYNQVYPLIADPSTHVNVSTGSFRTLSSLNNFPFTGITLIMGRYIDNSSIVNKWYLSAIINPLTGKQITFGYTPYQEDINTDKQIQYTGNTSGQFSNVTVYWDRNKIQGQRLSSVAFPDMERLDFTYSSQPRVDLPMENQLNSIQVSNNGNPVYTWQLNYGYMVGFENAIKPPSSSFTGQEQQWSRLCLQTAQKVGAAGTPEPPYQFSYYLGGDNSGTSDYVPPMFSIYQDKFGYYNAGQTGVNESTEGSWTSFYSENELRLYVLNASLTYKNPISAVAKNGILKSVTFPRGGMLTYAYEANQPQGQLGGVRVTTATRYDGISHTNDMVRQYAYVNANGTSSGWGGDNFSFKTTQTAVAAACSSTKSSPAVVSKQVASNYIQNAFLTGEFGFESSAALGTALGEALEGAIIAIFVGELIDAINGSPSAITDTYTEYTNVSPLVSNPLPWGYARTEVSDLIPANNTSAGKTVYDYSYPGGALDRPIDIPTPAFPSSYKPRYADWVYGLPETVTVYDNQNNIVKQTRNQYRFIVNNVGDPNFLSRSWAATTYTYSCTLTWQGPGTQNSNIQQEEYYPMTGHTELVRTDEVLYNSAQQTATSTVLYSYDQDLQLKFKYTTNSKGDSLETVYYHPYDYPTAQGAISTMINSNILDPVLSAETFIKKSDQNQYMTGCVNTDYDVFSNGDIKPKATYTFQNPYPLLYSNLQPFDLAHVQRDANYIKQTAIYDYDNYGNLVQTIGSGNKIVSNIYDYNGKFVVASATNASYADIGYSSFEAQGGKPGSWINTAAIYAGDARTGSNCYNLSDPSTAKSGYFGFSGMNSGLLYIVSFWSKNGTPCLTGSRGGQTTVSTCQGSTGWTQGATINGWTYYEVQLNNIDQVSVSGTGLIDEFRVYPVGAQMNTVTYSPLIGKTSECDASGRVTYYSYDDLGRLVKVSDDQRNTIRTYEYNYQQ